MSPASSAFRAGRSSRRTWNRRTPRKGPRRRVPRCAPWRPRSQARFEPRFDQFGAMLPPEIDWADSPTRTARSPAAWDVPKAVPRSRRSTSVLSRRLADRVPRWRRSSCRCRRCRLQPAQGEDGRKRWVCRLRSARWHVAARNHPVRVGRRRRRGATAIADRDAGRCRDHHQHSQHNHRSDKRSFH